MIRGMHRPPDRAAGDPAGAASQSRPDLASRDADQLVLGLDVGGTKLPAGGGAGSAGGSGRLAWWQGAPSRVEDGPAVMIGRLVELGRQASTESGAPPGGI